MLFNAECGGLPAIDVVTLCAFTLLRARVELAFMRIGFMAIVAIGERDFLLEIIFKVTGVAGHGGMLAEQRIFGLGVVEIVTGKHGFPTACGVAGIASLLELATVGIQVAIGAGREFHVLIADGAPGGVRFVTLFTGHFDVQSGQGITRLRMVEARHFPRFDVVTLGALIAEGAFVGIGMTRGTGGRLCEERLRWVLVLHEGT